MATSKAPADTYYDLLGLAPSASVQDIRRAYRDRSKLYHPDTTQLPPELAKAKFHLLNEAYATLSSPERRLQYDQKIGYSRIPVIQVRSDLNRPVNRDRIQPFRSTKDYLDPTDRPLSAGEMFALFLLGITFVACLILVVTIGLTQGESAFQSHPAQVPLDFFRSAHKQDAAVSQPGSSLSDPQSEFPATAPEAPPVQPSSSPLQQPSTPSQAPETTIPHLQAPSAAVPPFSNQQEDTRESARKQDTVSVPPSRPLSTQFGAQRSEAAFKAEPATKTVADPDIQVPGIDDKSL
ncbi:MAG: DnaJ domain-containing protein [Thainema sp.]